MKKKETKKKFIFESFRKRFCNKHWAKTCFKLVDFACHSFTDCECLKKKWCWSRFFACELIIITLLYV